ncbi:hypothetical protein a10_09470 [Streptomyces acidiscabies]|nr:hypothetical protein a10_09470 [Streptomyces acidiscabies]
MEEAGGEEGRGLVDRAGFFEEVAGGAFAEAGGEAFGEAVPAGEFCQGGHHARVQAGRPAAHAPRGERDPRQQAVPARVREADLFLRDDPQPVVDGLRALGGGCGDAPLHLRRVHPAAAQQEPYDVPDAREQQARGAGGGDRDRRVQPAYEAAGSGYVGVRGGARTGDDRREDRAEFADPHPPQEGGADDEDRRHGRTPVGGAGVGDLVAPDGLECAVRAVRAVLQPAVAVRRQGYRGGRGDVEPVGEVADQAVEVGRGGLGDRDRRAERRAGAGDEERDPGGGQEDDDGDDRDEPAGQVPAGADQVSRTSPGQQDHRRSRRQQGHAQRAPAHPQDREGPGTRGPHTRLHTDRTAAHARITPPPGSLASACLCSLPHCGTHH